LQKRKVPSSSIVYTAEANTHSDDTLEAATNALQVSDDDFHRLSYRHGVTVDTLRRLRTTFGTEIPRYYGRFQPHYRSITAITAAFARSQTPLPCSFLSPSPLCLPLYGQILDGIVVDGAHIVYCGCCRRYCCYFAPGIRRRSIVMTVSVCVCLFMCARWQNTSAGPQLIPMSRLTTAMYRPTKSQTLRPSSCTP